MIQILLSVPISGGMVALLAGVKLTLPVAIQYTNPAAESLPRIWYTVRLTEGAKAMTLNIFGEYK